MDKKLFAADATIQTATVEVKVMRIGKREMTLSVFRQLQEEPIIDEQTGKLTGEPWGRVNYHPDKGCTDSHEHEHVIWQKGNELRRARVHPCYAETSGWRSLRHDLGQEIGWHLSSCAAAGQRPSYLDIDTCMPSYGNAAKHIDVRVDGFEVFPTVSDAAMRLWHPDQARRLDPRTSHWRTDHAIDDETFAAEQEEMRAKALKHCGNWRPDDMWERQVQPIIDRLKAFRAAWQQHWDDVVALDQLFIAV